MCYDLTAMKREFSKPMDDKNPQAPATVLSVAELEFEDGKKHPIGRIATLGRAPDSDVVLNFPSVSRNHARIFLEGGHYWIKDLGSANGTKVNGKKIKLQMLSNQDKIIFGETKAVFRTSAQPAGPAPLGRDLFEGAETVLRDDSTPAGELKPSYGAMRSEQDRFRELQSTVERLRKENEALRLELEKSRATQDLAAENDRLRKLVSQLELTLADVNLRLRNLQDRFQPRQ
jgi:pSer/pThr/pTyr-binding forkhead associated (FHA) protein